MEDGAEASPRADSPRATPDAARTPVPWGTGIGVSLATIGVSAAWWRDGAIRLDEAGYTGLWSWDHFMTRGTRPNDVLESWTTISIAAAVTSRATVGTWVANVMNRHPAVLARMAATLQAASGGRVVVGIGIGGHPREHDAYGIPFPDVPERVARLEEAVAVLRALWAGGPIDLDGRYYPLRGAVALPRPDPAPPILVGAQSPAGARLAARIGDGWTTTPELLDSLLPVYREALETGGAARDASRVVVGFEAGRSGQDSVAGTVWADRPAAALAEWQARGADGVIVTARTEGDIRALLDAAGRG